MFGTRPEAIKVAPVVKAMERDGRITPIVVVTGQHREMLDQVLELFAITPAHDLDIMQPGQSLHELSSRILLGLTPLIDAEQPDVVVVHGDTTTTFAGALAASYLRLPVVHLEAGYRTDNRFLPYPEELNRRLVSELAEYHYAVNDTCRDNLLREGHDPARILVTGNTGIDAFRHALALAVDDPRVPPRDSRVPYRILMTMHRRESWGDAIESACRAARQVVEHDPQTEVIFATHLNPVVCGCAERVFSGCDRVHLVPALDYAPFARLIDSADIVLSDSGGIHEEALYLGKPLLLLRDVSEWPAALSSGATRLAGTVEDTIVAETRRALTMLREGEPWPRIDDPLADGDAAERVVADLARRLTAKDPA